MRNVKRKEKMDGGYKIMIKRKPREMGLLPISLSKLYYRYLHISVLNYKI